MRTAEGFSLSANVLEKTVKFTFSKPYTFEGTEYSEIDVDLDGMTGRDVSAAKREWTRQGNFSAVISTDVDFCACLAARAAKQPIEFVEGLPAKDYCRLAQEVSNFLLT